MPNPRPDPLARARSAIATAIDDFQQAGRNFGAAPDDGILHRAAWRALEARGEILRRAIADALDVAAQAQRDADVDRLAETDEGGYWSIWLDRQPLAPPAEGAPRG